MDVQRIISALDTIRFTDWDYYDGNHVWCRFCRSTKPHDADDCDLHFHDTDCIYRVACEELRLHHALDVDPAPPVKGIKKIVERAK